MSENWCLSDDLSLLSALRKRTRIGETLRTLERERERDRERLSIGARARNTSIPAEWTSLLRRAAPRAVSSPGRSRQTHRAVPARAAKTACPTTSRPAGSPADPRARTRARRACVRHATSRESLLHFCGEESITLGLRVTRVLAELSRSSFADCRVLRVGARSPAGCAALARSRASSACSSDGWRTCTMKPNHAPIASLRSNHGRTRLNQFDAPPRTHTSQRWTLSPQDIPSATTARRSQPASQSTHTLTHTHTHIHTHTPSTSAQQGAKVFRDTRLCVSLRYCSYVERLLTFDSTTAAFSSRDTGAGRTEVRRTQARVRSRAWAWAQRLADFCTCRTNALTLHHSTHN